LRTHLVDARVAAHGRGESYACVAYAVGATGAWPAVLFTVFTVLTLAFVIAAHALAAIFRTCVARLALTLGIAATPRAAKVIGGLDAQIVPTIVAAILILGANQRHAVVATSL